MLSHGAASIFTAAVQLTPGAAFTLTLLLRGVPAVVTEVKMCEARSSERPPTRTTFA
jgi:hypothetical protein